MFDRVPAMMQTMLDNGLQETLCNMIHAIHVTPARFSDLGCDERLLLLEDVQHFLTIIAEKTFRCVLVRVSMFCKKKMTNMVVFIQLV